MQTNEPPVLRDGDWLETFWDQPVTAVETATPEPDAGGHARLPLPEPGTVFLFGMAIVTALWQRLRRQRPDH